MYACFVFFEEHNDRKKHKPATHCSVENKMPLLDALKHDFTLKGFSERTPLCRFGG